MIGNLISAGASLLGGLFGSKSAKKDRQQQLAFAKNGISWKVADAKKAGIHPLYALGASTPGYTPVGSGGLAEGISNAGQAVGEGVSKATAKASPLVASQIGVNQAQKDLLIAQRETVLQNARNKALGATGVTNKLPNPERIETPIGNFTPARGTSSQKIEDDVGGGTAEVVGAIRSIGGIWNELAPDVKAAIIKAGKSKGYSRKYGGAYK